MLKIIQRTERDISRAQDQDDRSRDDLHATAKTSNASSGNRSTSKPHPKSVVSEDCWRYSVP
jgi:hypothetical protein